MWRYAGGKSSKAILCERTLERPDRSLSFCQALKREGEREKEQELILRDEIEELIICKDLSF